MRALDDRPDWRRDGADWPNREASRFVQAKQQVHILYGLPGRALEQVVDHTDDQKLAFVPVEVDDALVGIHHLLEVRIGGRAEYKGGIRVKCLEQLCRFFGFQVGVELGTCVNTPRKVAP